MSIPKNIFRKHIEKAINEINPDQIPSQRLEKRYKLIEKGKTLPPKYVISIANKFANGEELNFENFNAVEAKNFLIKNKFHVIDKQTDRKINKINIWIEKTLVKGNNDRIQGDRALGKALWSPQRSISGADVYKNMRLVQKGDIVLHLIDNKFFSGLSMVRKSAVEIKGTSVNELNVPAYIVKLENYTELKPVIERKDILTIKNKNILDSISEKSEVFYTSNLNLRQGAYLTPCPIELFHLINEKYNKLASQKLPFIEFLHIENLKNETMFQFDSKNLVQMLQKSGIQIQDKLLKRFTASLLVKPFVILTGLSGSGKTKLAQAFAMWICKDESQYCIVPVGADWTNREPLLGFPDALNKEEYVKPEHKVLDLIISAKKNSDKPYFLILDEMNLSHVERYFADFLSVMETKGNISLHSGKEIKSDVPGEIELPDNLFIIGTVNIDETTYMFSPKVLDRANVIEFRITADEIENYLKSDFNLNLDNLKSAGAEMAEHFVEIAKDKKLFPSDNIKSDLESELIVFFKELKKTGAEFGYRTAGEIYRFAAIVNLLEPGWSASDIIDAAIMQKLLPKVHGSRRKLEDVMFTLARLCIKEEVKNDLDFNIGSFLKIEDPESVSDKLIYPVSFEKISRMYKGLLSNSFTSYAES